MESLGQCVLSLLMPELPLPSQPASGSGSGSGTWETFKIPLWNCGVPRGGEWAPQLPLSSGTQTQLWIPQGRGKGVWGGGTELERQQRGGRGGAGGEGRKRQRGNRRERPEEAAEELCKRRDVPALTGSRQHHAQEVERLGGAILGALVCRSSGTDTPHRGETSFWGEGLWGLSFSKVTSICHPRECHCGVLLPRARGQGAGYGLSSGGSGSSEALGRVIQSLPDPGGGDEWGGPGRDTCGDLSFRPASFEGYWRRRKASGQMCDSFWSGQSPPRSWLEASMVKAAPGSSEPAPMVRSSSPG